MSIYLWLLTRKHSMRRATANWTRFRRRIRWPVESYSCIQSNRYRLQSLLSRTNKRAHQHTHTYTRPDGYTELPASAHAPASVFGHTHTHTRAREQKFTANTKPFISFYCISSPLMGPRPLLNYSRARVFTDFFRSLARCARFKIAVFGAVSARFAPTIQ